MAHHAPMKMKMATFRVTAEQHRLIEQRAKKCGVPVGAWMRSILMQAARRNSSEGYLRIREPNGAEI